MQVLVEGSAVIHLVRDQLPGPCAWATSPPLHLHRRQCRLGQHAFRRLCASQLQPDGQAIAVGNLHKHQSLAHWYALYTRSHCEQLVADQLAAKGFQVFLPKLETWSRRAGRQHLISLPMFPSYLFLHHAMDKTSYIEVRKARGLVRILGERWDQLGAIPEAEIEAIQKAVAACVPLFPHPYLKEGQRVHITHGPLAGMEGILVQSKPAKGLLVLSVELLQRSIAVQVAYSMT
jgi:transcription antitermination factor NusG